ncbi:hypothetical protein CK203_041999 [Vitis vinifera]|uniref:Uncharacterized protein n=1 Tax=Vitis vinifera TaxID=29760 RepID=A0A438I0I0_VITVI|nr:hypothetical protein CK203_041999 [Vitis vinifera]
MSSFCWEAVHAPEIVENIFYAINLDKESSSPFSQDYSSDNENASEDSPEELLEQPLGSDETCQSWIFEKCSFTKLVVELAISLVYFLIGAEKGYD